MLMSHERHVVSNHQSFDYLFPCLWGPTLKSALLAPCERNSPVNSPHKGPVRRKKFLFDDDIMYSASLAVCWHHATDDGVYTPWNRFYRMIKCEQTWVMYWYKFSPSVHILGINHLVSLEIINFNVFAGRNWFTVAFKGSLWWIALMR